MIRVFWLAVKAGKLANGAELGKGRLIHIIESDREPYSSPALCGERPAIQWITRDANTHEVTCPRCRRKSEGNMGKSKESLIEAAKHLVLHYEKNRTSFSLLRGDVPNTQAAAYIENQDKYISALMEAIAKAEGK